MEPIKFQKQSWNPVEEKEKEKHKIQFARNSWNQVEQKEVEKPKVEFAKQSWNPISGLQPPIVMRTFEGMNQMNPFAIKDSHATRTKNLSTKLFPSLTVRDGFSVMNDFGTAPIDGIAIYKGKELHVIAGGVWKAFIGNTWVTLKSGLNTTKKWTFINFQGSFTTMHLIATNGIDPAQKYNGTTVSALQNAPAVSEFVATHDNRVYIAAQNTVYFSALRKAEDWNTVNEAGQIVVETTDGKSITGIIAGSARLTVFKTNSIHELFGTRPDNFTMKTVTENLGTPTGKSAQVIEGVIYFLGNDGIYRYSGGSLPDSSFSIPVQEELKKINKGYAHNSVSWSIGRKYYLAFPKGVAQLPNAIVEYDLDFNTWNMWEYQDTVSCPFVQLDGITYGGNTAGELMKFDSDKDGTQPIYWEWHSKPIVMGSLAAKSRLFRLWVIADVPTGSQLNIAVADGTDLDNPTWLQIHSITGDDKMHRQQIYIPTSMINYSETFRIKLSGHGQVTIYELSRQERVFPMGQ